MFRNELTACLALVAPVGMTEEARADWLTVAWETLGHLPEDMLRHGCRKARETCDHHSKIVPAILAETGDWIATRRKLHGGPTIGPERRIEQREPERCTPEQARAIMREYGLGSRFGSERA